MTPVEMVMEKPTAWVRSLNEQQRRSVWEAAFRKRWKSCDYDRMQALLNATEEVLPIFTKEEIETLFAYVFHTYGPRTMLRTGKILFYARDLPLGRLETGKYREVGRKTLQKFIELKLVKDC